VSFSGFVYRDAFMARHDLNALLGTIMPFAQQMLETRGEFYPFGAVMTLAGEIKHTAASTGEEFPESQDLIDLLVGAFRAQAANNEVKAVGLCLDARTIAPGQTEKTDAICVRLRHSDRESIDVFLPYLKNKSGSISYSGLFAAQGQQDIWT
jgi:hypothetical protein